VDPALCDAAVDRTGAAARGPGGLEHHPAAGKPGNPNRVGGRRCACAASGLSTARGAWRPSTPIWWWTRPAAQRRPLTLIDSLGWNLRTG
jgi:hypothetical protein